MHTFGQAIRLSGVQVAIEDSHGDVDRLALYNCNAEVSAESLLPTGQILAIKEPFYKQTADGGHSVRVDHPTDLVKLRTEDSMIPKGLLPACLEPHQTALQIKNAGNEFYKNRCFMEALDAYDKALTECKNHESFLVHDIFRNRAIVNLQLKRYESALADAQGSLVNFNSSSDGSIESLNVKARYRAGRAAYCLGDFASAELYFKAILDVSPDDADAGHELERTTQRLREQSLGTYDFNEMQVATRRRPTRLDHASYISKTQVQPVERKGRGLFAKTVIAPGEVVLCEKAFSVVFDEDLAGDTYTIINVNTRRGAVGPRARLLFDLVEKTRHNPSEAQRFLDLYDGGYPDRVELTISNGEAAIDVFRTQAIADYNVFGCSANATRGMDKGEPAEPARKGSVGIWVQASYINHACSGNAVRAFIGDMMVIRASQRIATGDEILMPYRLPELDSTATRNHLSRIWGFECDCIICNAEKTSTSQVARRKTCQEIQAFLSRHRQSAKNRPSKSVIASAEKLHHHCQACYTHMGRQVPRLALAELGVWLCQAYSFRSAQHLVLKTATTALQDLGYHVQFDTFLGTIPDQSHGFLSMTAVDAAVYVAHAQYALKEEILGDRSLDFARSLNVTLNVDLQGFVERYGPA